MQLIRLNLEMPYLRNLTKQTATKLNLTALKVHLHYSFPIVFLIIEKVASVNSVNGPNNFFTIFIILFIFSYFMPP